MLKIEQKTYNCVDSYDLECLIKETFPCLSKYDIVANNYWNNDSCYEGKFYKIENQEYIHAAEIDVINNLVLNNTVDKSKIGGTLRPRLIYIALVEKGVVAEGDYLIKVSW